MPTPAHPDGSSYSAFCAPVPDGTDLTVTPATDAGGREYDFARGFICSADGTAVVTPVAGGSGVSIPVVAGAVYPVAIKAVTTAPGGSLVALF